MEVRLSLEGREMAPMVLLPRVMAPVISIEVPSKSAAVGEVISSGPNFLYQVLRIFYSKC